MRAPTGRAPLALGDRELQTTLGSTAPLISSSPTPTIPDLRWCNPFLLHHGWAGPASPAHWAKWYISSGDCLASLIIPAAIVVPALCFLLDCKSLWDEEPPYHFCSYFLFRNFCLKRKYGYNFLYCDLLKNEKHFRFHLYVAILLKKHSARERGIPLHMDLLIDGHFNLLSQSSYNSMVLELTIPSLSWAGLSALLTQRQTAVFNTHSNRRLLKELQGAIYAFWLQIYEKIGGGGELAASLHTELCNWPLGMNFDSFWTGHRNVLFEMRF